MEFIEIDKKSDEHKNFLYQLLCKRKYPISHSKLPTLSDHYKFVENHPYLKCFIVNNINKNIGSLYIMKDNCIGIDLISEEIKNLNNVIKYLINNHKPLNPIKSVRSSKFFINVSPFDNQKIEELESINAKLLQITYILE